MNDLFLTYAKKIQSIAQIGLSYGNNPYDIERYEQLRLISFEMMQALSNASVEKIAALFENEHGYQTPKIDVRGVIFRDDKILMVQEKADHGWTLPGGWADIGLTPNEIAVKEVWEESGLKVKAVRLLAILDKKCHPHPPSPWHVYKVFILCQETGGTLQAGLETMDAKFFDLSDIPTLSVERITEDQLKMCFDFKADPDKTAICD
jgi:ADP-ribose pyrophosphatase YjhB (NUDIX family)